MSAWYLFSSLGFYPVSPGSDQYALGSPAVESAVMTLENGKTLKILVKGQSDKNVYVRSVSLNGVKLPTPFISHQQLVSGGELVFEMSKSRK